jgi:hypothetical protein
LLLWVHCAEIDSYADVAHRAGIIDEDATEQYLAESVRAARIMSGRGSSFVSETSPLRRSADG